MNIISPNGTKTQYNNSTNSLTRIIGCKAYTVNLDKLRNFKVKDLARMTNLDDEEFSLMAYIQSNTANKQIKLIIGNEDRAYQIATSHYLTESFSYDMFLAIKPEEYVTEVYEYLSHEDLTSEIHSLAEAIGKGL